MVIAPPTLYLLLVREHLREGLQVAAQNVFDKPNGAFTGEISVEQLEDSGIQWALVGHSERRVILQEDDTVSVMRALPQTYHTCWQWKYNTDWWDQFVASKTKAALEGGLSVVLCIGEALEVRSLCVFRTSRNFALIAYDIVATRSRQDHRGCHQTTQSRCRPSQGLE